MMLLSLLVIEERDEDVGQGLQSYYWRKFDDDGIEIGAETSSFFFFQFYFFTFSHFLLY